jgi:hypothetical protein
MDSAPRTASNPPYSTRRNGVSQWSRNAAVVNGKEMEKKVINMRSFKTSDRKTKQDILFQDILTIVNRGVYDISSFLVRQGQVFHAQDLM